MRKVREGRVWNARLGKVRLRGKGSLGMGRKFQLTLNAACTLLAGSGSPGATSCVTSGLLGILECMYFSFRRSFSFLSSSALRFFFSFVNTVECLAGSCKKHVLIFQLWVVIADTSLFTG